VRILIHALNFSPETTGCGKLTGEMVTWLASRGHQVHIVTAPPYYPAWKIGEGYSGWSYQTERSADGRVLVLRCPLWVPSSPSGCRRVIHLASFGLSSLPVVIAQSFWAPEVILTVAPTLFVTPGSLLCGQLSGALTWLHVQDFEVDAAFGLHLLPSGGFIHKAAKTLERLVMSCYDCCSTISGNMVKRLLAKGVSPGRAVLFPNWVDTEQIFPQIAPTSSPNSFRAQLGLSPETVVLHYSGNLGNKQGLEILPQLVRIFAEDRRVHFLFAGAGSFRPELEKAVAGLTNVTLLPLQPLDRLNDLMNAADIHLLPQKSDAADIVMPSKLQAMLASGRPVVATARPGTQVAEVLANCGCCTTPGDVTALADAVRRLVDDSQLRRSLGAAAREYAVCHLGKEQVLSNFEAEILQRTEQRQAACGSDPCARPDQCACPDRVERFQNPNL